MRIPTHPDRVLRALAQEADRLVKIRDAIESHYKPDSPVFAELLSAVVNQVAREIERPPSPKLRGEIQAVAAKLGIVTSNTGGYLILRGCRPLAMTKQEAIEHARDIRTRGKRSRRASA